MASKPVPARLAILSQLFVRFRRPSLAQRGGSLSRVTGKSVSHGTTWQEGFASVERPWTEHVENSATVLQIANLTRHLRRQVTEADLWTACE